jgi:hypothetical protein
MNWREVVAKVSFMILVIVVPVGFGAAWSQHQRTDDLRRVTIALDLHDHEDEWRSYEGCLRGDVLRRNQAEVIAQLKLLVPDFDLKPAPVGQCKKPTVPRPKGLS